MKLEEAKIIVSVLFSLGILSFVYGVIIRDPSISLLGGIMGCGISYFIAYVASWEYSWDLNPLHKIGYCIRLAYESELRKPVNTSSKPSMEKSE